jgi:RNA polymerase sigma-70 factor (ECF subfamily)
MRTWMQQRLKPFVFNYKTGHLNLTATVYHDDLVEKCKQGDALSYEILYRKYATAMFNTSLRIVNNRSDAEDVLQEAFLAAFRFEQFDYSSTFGAWLKRIVINKSIDFLRRKKLTVIDIEDAVITNFTEETEQTDEEQIKFKVEEIKQAVIKLPSGYRTVISLHLFEGYNYEEIAETMNISPITVRTQYHRAKQKLLQLIQKGGLS